ncbi:glutamate formimidoyltransferase [Aggregatilineales bacterium SYSU G02658]
MTSLVECVPNFSEGRDQQVIAQLAEAVRGVPRVRLLHVTSDYDHHRSVLTFVGESEAVLEAAFRAIQAAAQLIDLKRHHGQHPRMGAADVVPFVPLGSTSLDACVELARRLGARVGAELGLPVYLYEAAAQRPERRLLAEVRRGGYERLRETIHLPERAPDYGPAVVGPAGAVIIGARLPLIAYNVFLKTDDVSIARRIARDIRESGGGLRAVRALGLLVSGQAQVSMNLTDYQVTPLHEVMQAVSTLASQHGVEIDRSELIGLLPQQAALDALAAYLKLPALRPEQLLYDNYLLEG